MNLSGRGDKDMDTAGALLRALRRGARSSREPRAVRPGRIARRRDRGRPGEGRGALIGYLPVGFPDLDDEHRRRRGARRERRRRPRARPAVLRPGHGRPGHPGGDPGGARRRVPARATTFTAVRAITEPRRCPGARHDLLEPGAAVRRRPLRGRPAAAGGAGLITPDITPDAAAEWIARERPHRPRPRVPRGADIDRRAPRPGRRRQPRLRLRRLDDGHHRGAQRRGCRRPHPRRAARATHGVAHASCVGIGISTAEQVAEVLEYADGAIVGHRARDALCATAASRRLVDARSELARGTRQQ